MALLLHKYESPKNTLCQIYLKLASWFWRTFLSFGILLLSHRYKAEILLIRHKTVINQSTLGKGCGPLFEKNFNSLSLNNALCQVWLKLV